MRLFCLLLTFMPFAAAAQTTYYYRGSGNIQTTSNWTTSTSGSGGSSPSNFTAGNQIFILGNSTLASLTVSLSAAWTISGTGSRLEVPGGTRLTTGAALTINGSASLVINNGGVVQSNSAITIHSSSTFQINNGGTYIHNNTTALSSSIFAGSESFAGASNFQINQWAGTSVTLLGAGFAGPYGNLIINWTSNNGVWQQGFGNTTVNLTSGNFVIQSTGTGQIAFATNRQPTVVVGGFQMQDGTVNFRTSNGGGSSATVNLDVTGDVNITGGSLTTGGNTAIGVIRSNGAGIKTWSINGGNRLYVTYEVATGTTVQLGSNFDMGSGIIGDKLVVYGTLDARDYVISDQTVVASPNYVGCLVEGTFRTSNPDGFVGLAASSLSNMPAPLQARFGIGCTIEFYASGNQVVSQAPSGFIPYGYENVIINGGGTKQLQGATTIDKVLSFASGSNRLDIAQHNLLISSTGNVSGFNTNSYVITNPTSNTNGRLRQNGLTASVNKVFPVGTPDLYLPVNITPTASSDFSVSVYRSTTLDGSVNGSPFGNRNNHVDAIWRVDRASGTANASVRFDWRTDAIEGATFSTLPNSNINIWRNPNGAPANWMLASTGHTSDNSANFSSTAAFITNFGTAGTGLPYLVGSTNLLSASFVSMQAVKQGRTSVLGWELSESAEMSKMAVERAVDGNQFSTLAIITAGSGLKYTFRDELPAGGKNYYRIKMTDLQGKVIYSEIASITHAVQQELNVMGNPAGAQLRFRHPAAEDAQYVILDITGKVLLSGKIPSGNYFTEVSIATLPAGQYMLKMYDRGKQLSKIFLHQ